MTVTSANGLSSGLGQNLIINGNFDVWQRGTSFTTTQYTADRWWSLANDTVTRESFSAVPEIPNGKYFIRLNPTQVGGYHTLQQIIENAGIIMSGKIVTLSFWARSSKGGAFDMSIISSIYGDYQIVQTTVSLTTNWQKYVVNLNIPVTTGQSDHRYIRFHTGTTAITYGFDIAQAKLEVGGVATPFSLAGNTVAGELQECQRYFETSYDLGVTPGTANEVQAVWSTVNAADTTLVNGTVFFKTQKRNTPLITIYNTATGATGSLVAGGTTYTVSTTSATTNFIGRVYTSTAMSANTYVRYSWTADSEIR